MKKILIYFTFIVSLIVLAGCEMNNTPTKRVEEYLNNYKNLDEEVVTQLDQTVNIDTVMTDDQKTDYKDVLKRQYQNMMYTIKDEVVDGDTATVTVEIEVFDFYKLTQESDTYYQTNPDEFKDETGTIAENKYIDYKLEQMKDYNEKVKYTIEFDLTKQDKTWILNDIDEATRQKIHGLYAY